jgi:NitT/TauT family transport system permease protein
VVGAVVGEFVGGDAGLGYLLMVANGSMPRHPATHHCG